MGGAATLFTNIIRFLAVQKHFTVAEQLGGGWPSRGQIGAWLKRRAVLRVARRDRVCFGDEAPRRADDTHRKSTIFV